MRTAKSRRAGRTASVSAIPAALSEHEGDRIEGGETYQIYRVGCPECAQPIALLADEERLPEHALCATWWDPFGMTVCPGTDRPVAHALHTSGEMDVRGDTAALLTLPAGLDWRTQPFSHAGEPSARPPRATATRG
ncbi:hypothetical protein [Streptomyces oceani]|uniref:Uncharacterized protein n=1 Tax=Streptomyces oceani TaxID=1075402 RepID=A0A1E7KIP1_9ACTN|nr:hypothetical protein [Streptomyces oceani]OEV03852.1 hypothetical protein AN216_09335 [Streptomyces oceani]